MPFVERVREASHGTINITVIPGGALTVGFTAIDDVTAGAIDLVWAVPSHNPGRFPLLTCFEFAGHFENAMEATRTIWEMLHESEAFRNEFAGFKLFDIHTTDMGEIWTVEPVRTPADFVNMTLRAASPMSDRMLKAYGAITLGMPMPDVYDTVVRDIIEGLGTIPYNIPIYNLDDVLSYGTDGLRLYTTPQIMAMSWDAWNQLSAWQQYIFDSLSGLGFSLASAFLYDDLGEHAKEIIPGITINRLTTAEKAAFAAASAGVVNEYLAELNSAGYNAQAFYDSMIRARDSLR